MLGPDVLDKGVGKLQNTLGSAGWDIWLAGFGILAGTADGHVGMGDFGVLGAQRAGICR